MKKILLLLLSGLMAFTAQAQTASSNIDRQLMQYFQNQEYAKAAIYLKFMANSDTANIRYLSLLGYSYYMSGQLVQAADCFQQLLQKDAHNSRAVYYLGKINAIKGNNPVALNYFCKLVTLKPDVAAYYKQLAALWDKLNNAAAATWYYELSYHLNPNDPAVITSLANHWIGQELYLKADSILDKALQQDSMQANILVARIHSAYGQKDYTTIFPLADQLEKMHFVTLQPFLLTAIAYFDLKKYDSSIAICEFLLGNKLKTKTVVYLEALSYKALHDYKKSLARLDECLAMALDDDADNYFSVKGDIYETLHQPSKALKQYDTAYYIFHHPLQLYNKARIYDASFENPHTALRYYRRYLSHRKGPAKGDERKVLSFVRKRVKQLAEWEKGRK